MAKEISDYGKFAKETKGRDAIALEILERKPIKIKVSDLKFDDTNPNRMSDAQMEGLRESMKRFGYLVPVIVDQNKVIADGEHRARIYQEFGRKQIDAYRVRFKDDRERRLLRQTMNKLRGEHDLRKDVEEIKAISKLDLGLADLAKLTAVREDSLLYFVRQSEEADIKALEVGMAEKELGELHTDNECPKCGYKW